MDDKGLLNQLIESGQFRFLQGELSLIRANPLSAPPAAPSSVLSIRYPGHTRLWTGGGASAGGEIGWLTSGWITPTRFLSVRIEDPLAMAIGGTGERVDKSRQAKPFLVLVPNLCVFS